MGDLMHALPALTDASRLWPDIEFDWVVDESFAEVPSWHPAVKNIYRSAHRRWKKNFWSALRHGELARFYRQLNGNDYDVVIDAQNNVKSAFTSLLRKGPVHGMDRESVAEQPAYLAYKKRYRIDRNQHAILRQRQLFAAVLGYDMPQTPPEYGLKENAFTEPDIKIPGPYLVLVHNASWTTKLWPEEYWHDLIEKAKEEGLQTVLPGGSNEELERARMIAQQHDNALALPRMKLSELGALIARAEGVICCDTGLAHLTAITGTPAVTLYGPTSATLIRTTGLNQSQLIASAPPFTCAPCYKRRCQYNNDNSGMSACMKAFTPESVWLGLKDVMKSRAL